MSPIFRKYPLACLAAICLWVTKRHAQWEILHPSRWGVALYVASLLLAGPLNAQVEDPTLNGGEPPEVTFEPIFDGVDFDSPVELGFAPSEEERIYVVEQEGTIQTWQDGMGEPTLFLDITDRVTFGGERGLLGLAFSPDYEASGALFALYTTTTDDTLRVHLSRLHRSGTDPPEADPASEDTLLVVTKPCANHNAGKLAFGPDGYLYVALGDGGCNGDPQGHGQGLDTLLGALLRIDVTSEPDPGEAYVIPPDNPFLNNPDYPDARPEIYAYGFRNPWKFSFHSETGTLWLADVGQDDWEEIDIVEAGENYGWNEMEGPVCFQPDCDPSLYEPPVFSYAHGAGDHEGHSVTGGVVFRDPDDPQLLGNYLFADFGNPRFWMLVEDGTGGYASVLLSDSVSNISTINERPSDKEVFVASINGGVFRLETANEDAGEESPASFVFELVGPNPVRDGTRVRIRLEETDDVRLRLVDTTGRVVSNLFSGRLASQEIRDFEIDARHLPAGIYLVVLDQNTSGRHVERVVVVR